MVRTPTTKSGETIKDRPHRYFYMVAVRETLERGERAEIEALLKGAKEVQAHYGDLNGLITHLEGAAKKAR